MPTGRTRFAQYLLYGAVIFLLCAGTLFVIHVTMEHNDRIPNLQDNPFLEAALWALGSSFAFFLTFGIVRK